MYSIRVTLPDPDHLATLLVLTDDVRVEGAQSDDCDITLRIPAASPDAASMVVNKFRQGLGLLSEAVDIGPPIKS